METDERENPLSDESPREIVNKLVRKLIVQPRDQGLRVAIECLLGEGGAGNDLSDRAILSVADRVAIEVLHVLHFSVSDLVINEVIRIEVKAGESWIPLFDLCNNMPPHQMVADALGTDGGQSEYGVMSLDTTVDLLSSIRKSHSQKQL
jgi:hypothetical protein